MDAVRTPLDHGTALALGNRRYRKQVLKVGDVHYQGGKFPVTDKYLDDVVRAFDSKAITKVPFQLADSSNRHTEDPLRRFGTVVGLHRTPDGLDAVLELDDEAARLVDKDPEFGVSVLIKHDRTTGEGQHYPAVLAHILGTTDPVLTSLAPWQPELAASHPVEDTLDLLALTSSAPRDEPTRKALMADTLAPEELAVLRSLLARLTPDEPADPATPVVEPATDLPADQPFTDGDPEPTDTPEPEGEAAEFTDEEIAAMVASLDDIPADEPEMVAAGHDSNAADLELSHQLEVEQQARRDSELRLAQVEAKLAAQEYEAERLQLAQRHGIPPRITDIVRPLLEGTGGKLALSNGGEVDPAALIRKFVVELASTPRLDLSQPVGSGQGVDIDDENTAAAERAELARLAVQSMS